MDFWQVHGFWFLFFIFLFPRLTMLFAVTVPFGWLAWLGWLFTPRLLIAILATTYYWDTNPVLCVFSWLNMMFGGGGSSMATTKAARSRR